MTNVQSIEQAVSTLSSDELTEFRRWFAEYDAARWDEQIEADAAVGKLDEMAAEALREFHDGRAVEL